MALQRTSTDDAFTYAPARIDAIVAVHAEAADHVAVGVDVDGAILAGLSLLQAVA